MVESNQQNEKLAEGQGAKEEEVVDSGWGLEPAPPLDEEGKASLAEFLGKIQVACSNTQATIW